MNTGWRIWYRIYDQAINQLSLFLLRTLKESHCACKADVGGDKQASAGCRACLVQQAVLCPLLPSARARVLAGTMRLGAGEAAQGGEAAASASQPWEHVSGACPPNQATLALGGGASKLRCSAVRVTQRRTAGDAAPTKACCGAEHLRMIMLMSIWVG